MVGAERTLVRLGWVAGAMGALCAVAWSIAVWMELSKPGYGGQSIDVDFGVWWAAARLTLAEGPLVPFDMDRLNAARALPPDLPTAPMLWLYPPGWLAVILPLGLMPFFWAWLAFGIVSLGLFAAALWLPARAVPGALPLALAAPVVLMTLALGQNSLIFAALLVLALEAIRRDRAVLAGLAIAAMTMKPQLGLAIPVALLAAGQWRVILWAAVATAAILGASLIWPGAAYWPAFFTGVQEGSEVIRDSYLPTIMASGYGMAAIAGAEREAALMVQGAISLTAAAALAWLWHNDTDFDIKAGGLALATLLITPYAMYYELCFAVVGCVYLARAGVFTNRAKAVLPLLLWLLPVAGIAVLRDGPGFAFAAPLVAATFALALWRARALT
ncbi:MAG: glycosyltransferase family 87 protein [Pseudomonadota bacterium]